MGTEEANDADDDLMSGFKSVSLNLYEDEAVADAKESGIQKLWDEIIPSELLEELEEEEKQKEQVEMYLGPRQRKTVLGEKTSNGSSRRKREVGVDLLREKTVIQTPKPSRKRSRRKMGF